MFKSLEMLRCIPECNTEIKYINLLNLTVAKATIAVIHHKTVNANSSHCRYYQQNNCSIFSNELFMLYY